MSLEVENLRIRLEEQIEVLKHFPNGPSYRSKENCAHFRYLIYKKAQYTYLIERSSHSTGIRKNLAKIYLESDKEIAGIFNLVESHAVSLRTRTHFRHNQAR
jgi:hypothetical protein